MAVDALKLDNVTKNFSGTEISEGLTYPSQKMRDTQLLVLMEQGSPLHTIS